MFRGYMKSAKQTTSLHIFSTIDIFSSLKTILNVVFESDVWHSCSHLNQNLHSSPSVDLIKQDFVQILIKCFFFNFSFLCEEIWWCYSNQQTAVLPNTQPLWSMCYLWRRVFTAPRLAETLRHVVRVAFELTLNECKYRRCLLVFFIIHYSTEWIQAIWSFCNVCAMIQLHGWMLIMVEWLYLVEWLYF